MQNTKLPSIRSFQVYFIKYKTQKESGGAGGYPSGGPIGGGPIGGGPIGGGSSSGNVCNLFSIALNGSNEQFESVRFVAFVVSASFKK